MNSTRPIWKAVALSYLLLITLLGYACLEQPIQIYGHELKKPDFSHFQKIEKKDDDIIFEQKSQNQPVKTLERPKPDTSAQRILLCGDSMSEVLFWSMREYCKYNGHFLKTVPWYSSSTTKWGNSDTLQKLIALYKPTLVLFSLGSNELFIPAIKTREKNIQSILRQAKGTRFIWIGPPNWKEDTGINDLILANMDSTTFFLSKNLKLPRAKDGAHPSKIGGAIWADTLCSWIVHQSKYPIRLAKPLPPQTPTVKK